MSLSDLRDVTDEFSDAGGGGDEMILMMLWSVERLAGDARSVRVVLLEADVVVDAVVVVVQIDKLTSALTAADIGFVVVDIVDAVSPAESTLVIVTCIKKNVVLKAD